MNLDRNFEAEKKPSVKVALLDDGCRLDNLHGGTQRGISFHSDHSEFWVGSCSHGTEMARCIRDVCPMAELYIARLDDSGKYENQKFTIPSCCDVSLPPILSISFNQCPGKISLIRWYADNDSIPGSTMGH